jgi:hypothetical protein
VVTLAVLAQPSIGHCGTGMPVCVSVRLMINVSRDQPVLTNRTIAHPFQSPTGDVVLIVVDVAPIWISAPHNKLVASLIII